MEKAEQKRRQRSLFSGLRAKPTKPKKTPQLPFDVLTKIFDLLSFKEIGEFTNEPYWRSRCKTFFGVTKKVAYKSWRITYKVHDYVHRNFDKIMDDIFSCPRFSLFHPPCICQNHNYKWIASSGRLRKFCNFASYQTKFVDAYCSKFMDLFKEQTPCLMTYDIDDSCYEEDFKAVEELVAAVLPILIEGSCIKKATDLIWEKLHPSESLEEWPEENPDYVEFGGLIKARVLYKWLKDYIEVDIPGPFPKKEDGSDWHKARGNAKAQYWAFVASFSSPVDI